MPAELLQAVRVDVLEPVIPMLALPSSLSRICPSLPTQGFAAPHEQDEMRGGGGQGVSTTYTLAAHLVTLLPSFRHSSSPRPAASVLHCM